MTGKPSKTWVFTINNYTDNDLVLLNNWNHDEFVSRLTATKEVGEQGTPHIQGAVTFKVAKRLSSLKKLHKEAHWEIRKCTDAALYCIKSDSDIVVNADYRHQGKPKDFDQCVELIRNGELKRVREEYPVLYCKHGRKFKEYNRDVSKPKNMEREVYWYWGGAGTGKTRAAVEEAGEDSWMSNGNLQWFDGYTGETNVVLDDLRASDTKYNYLLRLLDRYKMKVPIKGDMINWDATKIWITSPQPPHILLATMVNDDKDNVEQIMRRIKVVKEFK